MPDAVIDNPILNSPFREPMRHFRLGDDRVTSEVVEGRRESAYFMPIPAAKKPPFGQSLGPLADARDGDEPGG